MKINKKIIGILCGAVFVVAVAAFGYSKLPESKNGVSDDSSTSVAVHSCDIETGGQVWVEGGEFTMGDNKTYREEAPEHKVSIDGFWIDTHEVTNAQFAKFVKETKYVSVAERVPDPTLLKGAPPELFKPGAVVFTPPRKGDVIKNWWSYIPDTNWKHPQGPQSSIEGKDDYPVVQIAYEDAQAYAKWAGRELPTEAQFEFAARSKREAEKYAWGGDNVAPEGKHLANTWQGIFPVMDTAEDGYAGIAPVGCFEANDYKAYDLIGNVWEWTSNWYADNHNPKDVKNPKGPKPTTDKMGFPTRVLKGGSYMCTKSFCRRYRPSARHAQDTGLGSEHIGFRTVKNNK